MWQVAPRFTPDGRPEALLRFAFRTTRNLALDARLAAGGTEPDAALAARLGMRLNTFLENVGRARKALSDCLRRRGVAVEEMRT